MQWSPLPTTAVYLPFLKDALSLPVIGTKQSGHLTSCCSSKAPGNPQADFGYLLLSVSN